MNNKKLATALMTSVLTIALTGQALAAPIDYGEELKNAPQTTPYVSFTDLPQSHWAYSYIANMVQKKVLEGYVDNKFRAENTVTRAEFATIIVRASGIKPAKVNYASFSDVPTSNWASPFVESVKDYMTGYRLANGQYNFNPETPATREDITVAIVKLKGYDTRLANRAAVEPMFKDFDSVSESAKDYVAIAVKEGLVSGYPDETFRGQATITRAEASALLYRAFLYGNDNKQVGGSSTTPTAPVTQPTTPTTNPSMPNQSQAAKFSVDTIVGGLGQGEVDGPVSMAKINNVVSIVSDKEDNLYFLDWNGKAFADEKKKVRKFNKSNGTVETIRIQDNSIDNKNNLNDAYLQKLAINMANNKLYVSSLTPLQNKSGVYTMSANIHEVYPTVQLVTYTPFLINEDDRSRTYNSSVIPFIHFDNSNQILYGIGYQSTYWQSDYRSLLVQANLDAQGTVIANSKERTGPEFRSSEAIWMNNNVYIFDIYSKTLFKEQLFPRKIEEVKKFDTLTFDSLTSYNGKFYASSGTSIYELATDGTLTIFIDGKDLTYNDGNPITKISQMSFNSNGNVIIYDDQNKAIRMINL